ncbi:MAG TPA: YlxR family protein [Firmicutes bacterium]|nr:YlxR family protein [Bacillota bacterium]
MAKSGKAPKLRKIPQRMCVGCQQVRPKRELVRIVRTPAGEVEIDPTGKRAGRGAYICPDIGCLNIAVKKDKLDKALGHKVSREIVERLEAHLSGGKSGED